MPQPQRRTSSREFIDYGKIEAAKDPRQNTIIESRPERDWQDYFRENWAPLLHGATVGVPAAAGTVLSGGNPLGGILGGALGDQLYQFSQRLAPRTFGAPPEGLLESTLESGMQSGLNELFVQGVPAAKNLIRDKVVQRFFPVNPTVPIQEGLLESPPPGLNVTQYTQNKNAKDLVRAFLPEKEIDTLAARQGKAITGEAEKIVADISKGQANLKTTSGELARLNRVSTEDMFKAHTATKSQLYDLAENVEIPKVNVPAVRTEIVQSYLVDPRTGNPLPPVKKLVNIDIKGGVPVTKTSNFATKVLDSIDQNLVDYEQLHGESEAARKSTAKLKEVLADYTNLPVMRDLSARPVMGYETIKRNKEALDNLLNNKDTKEVFLSQHAAVLKTIRNLLSADVETVANAAAGRGVERDLLGNVIKPTWTREAGKAYTRASDFYEGYIKRYHPGTPAAEFTRAGRDLSLIESDQLAKGLTSAQEARSIVKGAGTKTPLATEYVLEGLRSAQNPTTKLWNGDTLLKYLEDTREVGKEVLNSDQREALKYFANRMRAVQSDTGESIRGALRLRLAGAAVALGAGALTGTTSALSGQGTLPTSAIVGGTLIASFALGRNEVRQLLMNPERLRLFTKLTSTAPGSAEATSIFKKLVKTGLKGARFYIQYNEDMDPIPATVNSEGKLTPVEK